MKVQELFESTWSGDVSTKWSPPEGFFKKSAVSIAKGLKAASKDLKQAMSRLNFYINRGGKNITADDKTRLEAAKAKLHKLYESTVLEFAPNDEKPLVPKLIHKSSGKEVEVGDKVKSSDGETVYVVGWKAPHKPASQGFIFTSDDPKAEAGMPGSNRSYVSVYDCEWINRTDRG